MTARRRQTAKKSSPIDQMRRELQEKERALKRDLEGRQRLLQEAPRLREEAERREREQIVAMRASRGGRRAVGPELLDHRHEVRAPRAAQRSTRIEKERQKLNFYALLVVLAAVVVYLIYHLP